MSTTAVLLCYCPACGARYQKLSIGEREHNCPEAESDEGEQETNQYTAPE